MSIPVAAQVPPPFRLADAYHAIRIVAPDVVVNAAGRCGAPNVDALERDPGRAVFDNTIGAACLAESCHEKGVHLLHISSGCIFPSGTHDESSTPSPWTVYGRSKYAAELALQCFPNVGIIRIRMPIAGYPHPRNLITKLAGYETVCDAVNSVTVVEDLVHVVEKAARDRMTGILHACNPGTVSHRQILEAYAGLVGTPAVKRWVKESELDVKVRRSHCALRSSRSEYEMPPIGERLPEILSAYREAMRRTA